jgi:hypothetical protein
MLDRLMTVQLHDIEAQFRGQAHDFIRRPVDEDTDRRDMVWEHRQDLSGNLRLDIAWGRTMKIQADPIGPRRHASDGILDAGQSTDLDEDSRI